MSITCYLFIDLLIWYDSFELFIISFLLFDNVTIVYYFIRNMPEGVEPPLFILPVTCI